MKLHQHFLAATMSAALTLSVAAPAFAAQQSLDIASTMQVPTLTIVMPTKTGVVLNPYGMTVTNKDLQIEEESGQIISPTMYVQSKTETPVRVEIQATPTAAKGIELVAAAPASNVTDKQIQLGVGYQFVDTADATVTYASPAASDAAAAAGTVGSTVVTESKFLKGLESSDEGQSSNTYGVNVFKSAYDGNEAGTYLALKMAGAMTGNPSSPWTAEDTLSVALAFTFTPVNMTANTPAASPSVTITSTKVAGDAGSANGATNIDVTAAANNLPSGVTVTNWAWTLGGTDAAMFDLATANAATPVVNYSGSATTGTYSATLTVTATLSDSSTLTANVAITGEIN